MYCLSSGGRKSKIRMLSGLVPFGVSEAKNLSQASSLASGACQQALLCLRLLNRHPTSASICTWGSPSMHAGSRFPVFLRTPVLLVRAAPTDLSGT